MYIHTATFAVAFPVVVGMLYKYCFSMGADKGTAFISASYSSLASHRQILYILPLPTAQ